MTTTVIFTCHNRCDMTINCIKSLVEGNSNISFSFVVVDDNSTDGTKDNIDSLINAGYDIHCISGDGNLFWAGGMRVGIDYVLKNTSTDYYLFVNDDVAFESLVIEDMIAEYGTKSNVDNCKAMVGATYDDEGKLSYGGIKYTGKGVKYESKGPDYRGECDTLCMNCVLVDKDTFFKCGNFDEKYKHSLADFDYGLKISREVGNIYMFSKYVGKCNGNPIERTWQDTTLPRIKRLKLKESIKGAPFGTWTHFLNKNFGLIKAIVYGISPYIRIIMGR